MLPSTNITTTMVGNELGISSRDIGTLCTSDKINMWSKKKPVVILNPAPDRTADWWKADSGMCGFEIPSSGNSDQIIDQNWTYLKPTGGAAPKRIADFAGYYHDAPPILTNPNGSEITVHINKGSVQLRFDTNDVSDYNLSIQDMDKSEIGNCYITAHIQGDSIDTKVSASAMIKNNSTQNEALFIDISLAGFKRTSYTIKLYLSSVKHIQGGSPMQEIAYPFPRTQGSSNTIILNVQGGSNMQIRFKEMSYSLYGVFKTLEEVEPSNWSVEWVLMTNGTYVAKMVVTADTSITLTATQLRLHTDTLWPGPKQVVYGSLYNSSLQKQTSMLIPGGVPTEIYMDYTNALIYKNGQPTIPGASDPGSSPMYIDSEVFYYDQSNNPDSTGGHAGYFAQYGNNGWQKKNVEDSGPM